MSTGNTQLDRDIRKVQETGQAVKHSLIEKIMALPDNPRISRMGTQGNCFTMNSSDLGLAWSPEYHDFKKQHEYLAIIINQRDVFKIMPALRKIIETGKYRMKAGDTITFHPDVIKQLERILV